MGRAGILVLASHNPALLERTCAKGILLDAGRVTAFGPVGDMLREYEKGLDGTCASGGNISALVGLGRMTA